MLSPETVAYYIAEARRQRSLAVIDLLHRTGRALRRLVGAPVPSGREAHRPT